MSITRTQSELKERIARGLNFGIEALEEVLLPDSKIFDQFILIKSKYNDLMQFSAINVLPYEQLEVGFDRIRNNLLQLISDLKEDDLEKSHVEQDLKSKNLPTVRANFFQLLDLYYRNLGALTYTESFYDSSAGKYEKDHYHGREAIYKYFGMLARKHNSVKEKATREVVQGYLQEFFQNEIGLLEVYLKNVHHLAKYIQDMEIDRDFFLTTLKSSLSRFELAILYYYAVSEVNPAFNDTAFSIGLFDQGLSRSLFEDSHIHWLL